MSQLLTYSFRGFSGWEVHDIVNKEKKKIMNFSFNIFNKGVNDYLVLLTYSIRYFTSGIFRTITLNTDSGKMQRVHFREHILIHLPFYSTSTPIRTEQR